MPKARQSNVLDRLIDLLLTRQPKGRERALLEATQPPLWVRLTFQALYLSGVCVLILSVIHREGWLNFPWDPARWPRWYLVFGLLMAGQFAYREIHRQYGKRALREDQASQ